MAALLITYDLNKESKRPPIVDLIREFPSWARLSESSYAVQTDLSVNEVYKKFDRLTDANDQIYIITLSQPWMGFGPKEVNDWLDENLPWLT